MDEVRAAVRDYADFLNGKEVRATVIGRPARNLTPGDTVVAFKHTLAAETGVTVPRAQQSHYIGVEATVTDVIIDEVSSSQKPSLRVRKR